ncbi:hypothetical protein [Actinoplanes sp. NPDC026619]|uniref:hypothetical protein n=1 Tax=Actinoplanes sp. NPDC026619 TaxID=3155798 RepID=UPI0033DC4A7F
MNAIVSAHEPVLPGSTHPPEIRAPGVAVAPTVSRTVNDTLPAAATSATQVTLTAESRAQVVPVIAVPGGAVIAIGAARNSEMPVLRNVTGMSTKDPGNKVSSAGWPTLTRRAVLGAPTVASSGVSRTVSPRRSTVIAGVQVSPSVASAAAATVKARAPAEKPQVMAETPSVQGAPPRSAAVTVTPVGRPLVSRVTVVRSRASVVCSVSVAWPVPPGVTTAPWTTDVITPASASPRTKSLIGVSQAASPSRSKHPPVTVAEAGAAGMTTGSFQVAIGPVPPTPTVQARVVAEVRSQSASVAASSVPNVVPAGARTATGTSRPGTAPPELATVATRSTVSPRSATPAAGTGTTTPMAYAGAPTRARTPLTAMLAPPIPLTVMRGAQTAPAVAFGAIVTGTARTAAPSTSSQVMAVASAVQPGPGSAEMPAGSPPSGITTRMSSTDGTGVITMVASPVAVTGAVCTLTRRSKGISRGTARATSPAPQAPLSSRSMQPPVSGAVGSAVASTSIGRLGPAAAVAPAGTVTGQEVRPVAPVEQPPGRVPKVAPTGRITPTGAAMASDGPGLDSVNVTVPVPPGRIGAGAATTAPRAVTAASTVASVRLTSRSPVLSAARMAVAAQAAPGVAPAGTEIGSVMRPREVLAQAHSTAMAVVWHVPPAEAVTAPSVNPAGGSGTASVTPVRAEPATVTTTSSVVPGVIDAGVAVIVARRSSGTSSLMSGIGVHPGVPAAVTQPPVRVISGSALAGICTGRLSVVEAPRARVTGQLTTMAGVAEQALGRKVVPAGAVAVTVRAVASDGPSLRTTTPTAAVPPAGVTPSAGPVAETTVRVLCGVSTTARAPVSAAVSAPSATSTATTQVAAGADGSAVSPSVMPVVGRSTWVQTIGTAVVQAPPGTVALVIDRPAGNAVGTVTVRSCSAVVDARSIPAVPVVPGTTVAGSRATVRRRRSGVPTWIVGIAVAQTAAIWTHPPVRLEPGAAVGSTTTGIG